MLFIDGANWHYGLKSIGVDSGRLDYRRLARKKLREVMAESQAILPDEIVEKLNALCLRRTPYYVEKQVDVRIAVDLVGMAHRNEYDVAYLLSADGDFVPAVEEAKRFEKQVFAASAQQGRQLAMAVDAFIPLTLDWFHET